MLGKARACKHSEETCGGRLVWQLDPSRWPRDVAGSPNTDDVVCYAREEFGPPGSDPPATTWCVSRTVGILYENVESARTFAPRRLGPQGATPAR